MSAIGDAIGTDILVYRRAVTQAFAAAHPNPLNPPTAAEIEALKVATWKAEGNAIAQYLAPGGGAIDTQGTDVVAAGDLTLGTGDVFVVTGSSTINGLAKADASAGKRVTLRFTGTPTLTHDGSPGAGFGKLALSYHEDATPSGPFVITLRLFSDGKWYQDSPLVIL